MITYPVKYWMIFRIHSPNSTVVPLKFGNRQFHLTLDDIWNYYSIPIYKLVHVNKNNGPHGNLPWPPMRVYIWWTFVLPDLITFSLISLDLCDSKCTLIRTSVFIFTKHLPLTDFMLNIGSMSIGWSFASSKTMLSITYPHPILS